MFQFVSTIQRRLQHSSTATSATVSLAAQLTRPTVPFHGVTETGGKSHHTVHYYCTVTLALIRFAFGPEVQTRPFCLLKSRNVTLFHLFSMLNSPIVNCYKINNRFKFLVQRHNGRCPLGRHCGLITVTNKIIACSATTSNKFISV